VRRDSKDKLNGFATEVGSIAEVAQSCARPCPSWRIWTFCQGLGAEMLAPSEKTCCFRIDTPFRWSWGSWHPTRILLRLRCQWPGVPDLDRLILACRRQPFPVRAKRHAHDPAGVPFQSERLLTAREVRGEHGAGDERRLPRPAVSLLKLKTRRESVIRRRFDRIMVFSPAFPLLF